MCHRDIDPRNILTKEGVIKLVDFGFSYQLERKSQKVVSLIGKPLYAAPEIIFNDEEYDGRKADIFSYGCVMYFLCTGKDVCNKIPLSTFSQMDQLSQVKISDIYHDDLNALILSCLKKNAKERSSIDDILGNPIFKIIQTQKEHKENLNDLRNPKNSYQKFGAQNTSEFHQSLSLVGNLYNHFNDTGDSLTGNDEVN